MKNLDLSSKESFGTGEVARLLNLSIGTVQKMVESGRLQAWKTDGGHRRILGSSLREYRRTVNFKIKELSAPSDKIGVLLNSSNFKKFGLSNAGSISNIGCYYFENMFHVISDYEKIKPRIMLMDFESISNSFDLECLMLLIKNFSPIDIFVIILISENKNSEEAVKLSNFKNVILLSGYDEFSWLSGFILGLNNRYIT